MSGQYSKEKLNLEKQEHPAAMHICSKLKDS